LKAAPEAGTIRLTPFAKVGLVAGGYLAALATTWVAVKSYIAATSGPDRELYAAMYDFGDSLLFLAVLGVAATVPTGAALYWLRPSPGFWARLSIAALTIAWTSLAAMPAYFAPMAFGASGPLRTLSSIAVLRILVAPLFVLFFLLSSLLAPNRKARISLLAATAMEAVAFACVASWWFHSSR